MNVLLSIKPAYTREILAGRKTFEFRKRASPKWRAGSLRVFIYSSAPEQRIVGYFRVGRIIRSTPEEIWEECQAQAGISREGFFSYFAGKTEGFALEIDHLHVFPAPVDPKEVLSPDFTPPQSFCYLDSPWAAQFSHQVLPAQ